MTKDRQSENAPYSIRAGEILNRVAARVLFREIDRHGLLRYQRW